MLEPTNEQLKELHKDIISGDIMTITTEHYKQQAEQIKKLEEAIMCFLDRWKKSGPSGSAQWEKFNFSIQILEQALKGKPHECKTCWYSCEVKNINECPLILKAKEATKTIETQVICGLVDCLQRNTKGECGHTSIHFQPCSDAVNVAACSEYTE